MGRWAEIMGIFTFRKYFDAEMRLLIAYDIGEMTYSDAYRHCFRVAKNIMALDV